MTNGPRNKEMTMSLIRHNAARETFDLDEIERGLENGRTLRSLAFTGFLKSLFVRNKEVRLEEDGRVAGCTAAA
jgi:hypothetical protein